MEIYLGGGWGTGPSSLRKVGILKCVQEYFEAANYFTYLRVVNHQTKCFYFFLFSLYLTMQSQEQPLIT